MIFSIEAKLFTVWWGTSLNFYKGTSEMLERCERMTFEIICKCLLGEFENETQATSRWDTFYCAMEKLSDGMVWRYKNFWIIKILQMIPLGFTLLSEFFKTLAIG